MKDYQTERRQKELTDWQRQSLSDIIGATSKKPAEQGPFARIVTEVMTWIGLWWMGVVAIWVIAAVAGFYAEMAISGWDFGRGMLRWVWELPR